METVKESRWKACDWMTKSDRQPSKKWEKQKDGGLNYADDCGMGVKVIVKVKEGLEALEVKYL